MTTSWQHNLCNTRATQTSARACFLQMDSWWLMLPLKLILLKNLNRFLWSRTNIPLKKVLERRQHPRYLSSTVKSFKNLSNSIISRSRNEYAIYEEIKDIFTVGLSTPASICLHSRTNSPKTHFKFSSWRIKSLLYFFYNSLNLIPIHPLLFHWILQYL